jgi:hypothetical protein
MNSTSVITKRPAKPYANADTFCAALDAALDECDHPYGRVVYLPSEALLGQKSFDGGIHRSHLDAPDPEDDATEDDESTTDVEDTEVRRVTRTRIAYEFRGSESVDDWHDGSTRTDVSYRFMVPEHETATVFPIPVERRAYPPDREATDWHVVGHLSGGGIMERF